MVKGVTGNREEKCILTEQFETAFLSDNCKPARSRLAAIFKVDDVIVGAYR